MRTCAKSSRLPETAMLNLRGRFPHFGLPRFPVAGSSEMRSFSASQNGRVSTSSASSTPASGEPTTFRTLSIADWKLVWLCEAWSFSMRAAPSSMVSPRSWTFCRVVTSITPSSGPYGSIAAAYSRSAALRTIPFGVRSRSMNRPGVFLNRDSIPAHFSRMFASPASISSTLYFPLRTAAAYANRSRHAEVGSFASFVCSILFPSLFARSTVSAGRNEIPVACRFRRPGKDDSTRCPARRTTPAPGITRPRHAAVHNATSHTHRIRTAARCCRISRGPRLQSGR
mmetsp:Transcript_3973/g.12211  ORF Transcript_3973/g.12211 Transcript_3973/m.12211 type:complete len:284 (+) Transcript_3973:1601-2452(+)